jgi:hypothetical protein
MFTITLAFINAKYDAGYEGLFGLTAFLDILLILFGAMALGVK